MWRTVYAILWFATFGLRWKYVWETIVIRAFECRAFVCVWMGYKQTQSQFQRIQYSHDTLVRIVPEMNSKPSLLDVINP